MARKVDWSELDRRRGEVKGRLPALLDLPIVPGYMDFALAVVRDGDAVLDIGAGPGGFRELLARQRPAAEYASLDVDPDHAHDYASIDEVDRSFDVAVLLEIIEHVPLEEAVDLFGKVAALLRPGGRIVVSTPNIQHPNWFWRDATHITPFAYRDLAGWLLGAGFGNLRAARVRRMKLRDRLRAWRYRGLLRLLGVDYTKGIVISGELAAGGDR